MRAGGGSRGPGEMQFPVTDPRNGAPKRPADNATSKRAPKSRSPCLHRSTAPGGPRPPPPALERPRQCHASFPLFPHRFARPSGGGLAADGRRVQVREAGDGCLPEWGPPAARLQRSGWRGRPTVDRNPLRAPAPGGRCERRASDREAPQAVRVRSHGDGTARLSRDGVPVEFVGTAPQATFPGARVPSGAQRRSGRGVIGSCAHSPRERARREWWGHGAALRALASFNPRRV